MYILHPVQLTNDTARRSEDVARRLPGLEACARSDVETLHSCVSDRLHFCSSPDFDDNAEVAYTFPPALALYTTYPMSLVTAPIVNGDLLTPSMGSFTGTVVSNRNI
jgi:hypothetical protein